MDRVKGGSSLDGCGKFIKYSIFIVNFLLFLGGLAVIGLGIWVLVATSPTQKVLDQNGGIIGAAILLAFGGFLAFITFLGCCGAIKEVKCLLLTFFIFVLLIAILFIVAVVIVYKFGNQAEDFVIGVMNKTLHDKEAADAWDYMQRHFKCCGVTKYTDWSPNTPDSCLCDPPKCVDFKYWSQGCETYLRDELKSLSTPILGVVITVIVILILSLVFTCSLVLMI